MRKVVATVFAVLLVVLPLYAQQPDAPEQPRVFELGALYSAALVTDGDQTGKAFELSASRTMFSNWTGVALNLSYQSVVNTDFHSVAAISPWEWADKHTYAADLDFFIEPLRFETGAVGHRFRFGAGPSVQRRSGEEADELLYPAFFEGASPGALEELTALVAQYENLHLYAFQLEGSDTHQNGQYAFVTRDWMGTEWGALLRLSYGAEFENFTAGVNVAGRLYQHQYKVWSTGLSFGYQF